MSKPSRKKLQVFISSTFTDLKEERQAAVSAILGNGHIPAGMELFAAGDEEQMKVIRRWIEDSDVFMLILGKRYGSVEPNSKKSYTHLEYEYAVSLGKPLFALVLSDQMSNAKVKAGADVEDVYERHNHAGYNDLCEQVKSRMCRFVDDFKDIRLGVWESLKDLESRHEFSGWVRETEVANVGEVLQNVASTAQHNAKLQNENAELSKSVAKLRSEIAARKDYGDRTFKELGEILLHQKVNFDTGDGKMIERSLLELMHIAKAELAAGVINAASASDYEREVFNQIAAPLAVHNLMEHARVPASVYWQRLVLSASGKRFLSELDFRVTKKKIGESKVRSEEEDARDKPLPPQPAPIPAAEKKKRVHAAVKSKGTDGNAAPARQPSAAKKNRRRAGTK